MQTQREASLEIVRRCNQLFQAAEYPCHAVVVEVNPFLVQFLATDADPLIFPVCEYDDALPIALRAVDMRRAHA